jgi:hypothetical protein
LEALGPVDPREIPDVIKEIKAEGHSFVPAPALRATWPKRTDDPASQIPENEEPDGCTT